MKAGRIEDRRMLSVVRLCFLTIVLVPKLPVGNTPLRSSASQSEN